MATASFINSGVVLVLRSHVDGLVEGVVLIHSFFLKPKSRHQQREAAVKAADTNNSAHS